MNSHHTSFRLFATSLLACAGATTAAFADNASPKAANSSGLTVAIAKVALNQKQLVFQFTIKNNTKGRAYIIDARNDRKQNGFLGSGEQLNQPPHLSGINLCEDNLEHCASAPFSSDLARFSYIEPGEFTAFAATWTAQNAVSDKDTFTFTIPIVARFASETGDPNQAGGAKPIQFNFPFVHLDRDN
jgi:hypothetical protein